MLKLLGLTTGGAVRFRPFDECKIWMTKAGGEVSTIKPLDRGRPYSHAAVVTYKLSCGNYSASISQTL